MASENERLRAVILNANLPADERIAAVEALVAADAAAAKGPSLEICEREEEPEGIVRAAADALGTVSDSGVFVSEFDMRNFTSTAAKVFSDWPP